MSTATINGGRRRLHVQLWSYNFDPEPMGIAPISTVWAEAMRDRGHRVEVVAAHPHYPEPVWGRRLWPYTEARRGVTVHRYPLLPGRSSAARRLGQELSYAGAVSAGAPGLPTPDVVLATSPSFPALVPAMLNARARRVPWALWLHDILPDGAVATDLLADGPIVRAARRFEVAAYRSAARIFVISETFEETLRAKGVPAAKIVRNYNPMTLPVQAERVADGVAGRVLFMGNIGRSQGVAEIVRAFEDSPALASQDATFVLAGDGVAGDQVRAQIRSDRVRVTGALHSEQALMDELRQARVACVSQSYEGHDFNVPCKLQNYMGFGLPVVASVRADSGVARIVEDSGCGWVTDSAEPRAWATKVADVLKRPDDLAQRGQAGLEYARREFAPEAMAERFERVLGDIVAGRPR